MSDEKKANPVKPAADPKRELADMEADLARLTAEVDSKRVEVLAGGRHYFGPPGPPVDVDA